MKVRLPTLTMLMVVWSAIGVGGCQHAMPTDSPPDDLLDAGGIRDMVTGRFLLPLSQGEQSMVALHADGGDLITKYHPGGDVFLGSWFVDDERRDWYLQADRLCYTLDNFTPPTCVAVSGRDDTLRFHDPDGQVRETFLVLTRRPDWY